MRRVLVELCFNVNASYPVRSQARRTLPPEIVKVRRENYRVVCAVAVLCLKYINKRITN